MNVDPYARPTRTTREPEPVAPRWDIQVRKRKEPASQHLAREAAWMISRGELQPKEELQRDKFAPTTRGPKNARRAFVEQLVSISERGGPVYPLTPDKLENAASCLKWGKYKAPAGYLSELKQGHIKHPNGRVWTDVLALEMKESVRSCLRGMGPPERAPEVGVALVAAAPDWDNRGVGPSKAKRGPRRPRRAWVTATGWGNREIELSGLTLHVSSVETWFDEPVLDRALWVRVRRRKTRCHLPLTKADQGGKGSPRTWACICHWPALPDGNVHLGESQMCPACVVGRQLEERLAETGVAPNDPRAKTFPLFPDHAGRFPTKEGTVAAWEDLFEHTCEQIISGGGYTPEAEAAAAAYDGVTGHSARRSGAKLWARCGWSRELIAFLYRWGSAAILAYIEEVVAIGQEFGDLLAPVPIPAAIAKAESDAPSLPESARAEWQEEIAQLRSLVLSRGEKRSDEGRAWRRSVANTSAALDEVSADIANLQEDALLRERELQIDMEGALDTLLSLIHI